MILEWWRYIRKCLTNNIDCDHVEKDGMEEDKTESHTDPYSCNRNKVDTIMKVIDTNLKSGSPLRGGFKLIITTKDNALSHFTYSNMKFKVACKESIDKQFILKNLNYDYILLDGIDNAYAASIFDAEKIPSIGYNYNDNCHYLASPGDILCFDDDDNTLYVFQYRGDYLTNEQILSASFNTSNNVMNNGGSSNMKLNYITSMDDSNSNIIYSEQEPSWIDIFEYMTNK